MSSRTRKLVFVALTATAVVVAGAYVAWAVLGSDESEQPPAAPAALHAATAQMPYLVYQHVARGPHYGEVAVSPSPLQAPRSSPAWSANASTSPPVAASA